jgi:hypothetical protein
MTDFQFLFAVTVVINLLSIYCSVRGIVMIRDFRRRNRRLADFIARALTEGLSVFPNKNINTKIMNPNQNAVQHVELEIVQPTALESIERANVDMQISTAKKYPRSLALVKGRMMDLATLDQETAESCFYKLNRQGKSIEGPSIRLAEIAASSFGNIRYGARVISNDGKKITAQGFSHDLETNVYCAVEISRRITNRDGMTYSEDMQVVTGNAACAIALRNAMFKVVPFALVKPIYEAANRLPSATSKRSRNDERGC